MCQALAQTMFLYSTKQKNSAACAVQFETGRFMGKGVFILRKSVRTTEDFAHLSHDLICLHT